MSPAKSARSATKHQRKPSHSIPAAGPSASPEHDTRDAFTTAVEAHRSGLTDVAEPLYRRILAQAPEHAESWSNLALILVSRRAHAEAIDACHRALTVLPDYAEAHFNLIAALEGAGRAQEALPVYQKALALAPGRSDLLSNFAMLLESLGRLDEAAQIHAEAAALDPGSAYLHFNLGRAAALLQRMEDAVRSYRDALAINPDLVEALSAMSSALVTLGRYDAAAEAARRAQTLRPDDADIANNCAVVLQQGGKTAEAADMYRLALSADPGHAGAWANLGIALQELFRFDDAVEAFAQAIAVKPDFHSAIVEAIKIRRHICDWTRYDEDHGTLLDLIGRDTDAIFMLLLMAFPSTAAQQSTCARQHMAELNRAPQRLTIPVHRVVNARLRVGYLSHDYRGHPVGRLLPGMLAQHDRGAVEVFGYALGLDDTGRLRRRVARACDHFVDLHGMSDLDAAMRIRDDRIDVLVDLTGPTTGARFGLLNLRPAPVQVSFLGWPGTTGMDCIDYVIGDSFLISGDQQPVYSEKIVQLPICYQPSDPYRAALLPPLTRAECGLPDGAFVFCSFNNTLKLTPDLFDLWLRLLARVEGSVLWLYCKTPRTMANLKAWAETRGIAAERIVFAPVASMELYLSRLRLADLFLDSHPYNAGATCNDALWMGLPVLTWTGETYVSRMAGSLLRAAGLPELITWSAEDYEARAVRLATEPEFLAEIKGRLVRERDASPLFDMPGFTASWERALNHMRYRSLKGLQPEGFAITDTSV